MGEKKTKLYSGANVCVCVCSNFFEKPWDKSIVIFVWAFSDKKFVIGRAIPNDSKLRIMNNESNKVYNFSLTLPSLSLTFYKKISLILKTTFC